MVIAPKLLDILKPGYEQQRRTENGREKRNIRISKEK